MTEAVARHLCVICHVLSNSLFDDVARRLRKLARVTNVSMVENVKLDRLPLVLGGGMFIGIRILTALVGSRAAK